MFLSKRNGVYYLWYNDAQGRRQKISTKSNTKKDALGFVRTFRPQDTLIIPILPRKTITELFHEFKEHSVTIHTRHTQRCYNDCMEQFIQAIGKNREVSGVSVREIERYLDNKRAKVSNWTARRHHIVLSSVFEAAKRWGYVSSNPCRQVPRAKMVEVQPLFFSQDELKIVCNAIEDLAFRDLVICAFATGLRLGEIVSMRWSQVDLSKRIINVQSIEGFTTKSKKCRVIPMNDLVFDLMQRRVGDQVCDFVFHSGGKRFLEDHVSKVFKKYVIKSGVNPKLHFHSLRHSFCSILVQQGASLYEVQKLAGHSSQIVTQIYAHLQPEQLHETVNKIHLDLS
jgi:site-specific recombinase XerD